VQQEQQGLKVMLVLKVLLDQQERLVPLDHKVHKEPQDIQVLKVL
jgi:hypothetical protein